MRWRGDFFPHAAYLTARVPRCKCDEHGVKAVPVPWARAGSGFTLLFEALLLAHARRAGASVTDMDQRRLLFGMEGRGHDTLQAFKEDLEAHNGKAEQIQEACIDWFRGYLTNGFAEGLNSILQAAKAKARGYSTTRNLLTIAYLLADKLSYGLPT